MYFEIKPVSFQLRGWLDKPDLAYSQEITVNGMQTERELELSYCLGTPTWGAQQQYNFIFVCEKNKNK